MENIIKSNYFNNNKNIEIPVNARILSKYDNLKQILTYTADSNSINTDISDGILEVNGKINIRILAWDTEEGVVSLNYNTDFQDTMPIEWINEKSNLIYDTIIKEINAKLISENEVEFTAIAAINITEIQNEEIQIDKVPDNLILRNDTINIGSISSRLNKTIKVNYETDMQKNIMKILQADSEVMLKSAVLEDEILKISGNIYMQLICLNDEKLPSVLILPVPFDEEIEADKFTSCSLPFVRLNSTSTKVHIDTSEENGIKLNATISIDVNAMCIENKEYDCVCDAYSINHNIELNYNNISNMHYNGNTNASINFSGIVESADSISKVLGVYNCKNKLLNTECDNGNASINGIVSGTLLYYDINENIKNELFDLPYSETIKIPDCDVNNTLIIDTCITNISALKNNTGAELNGTFSIIAYIIANDNQKIMTSVVIGEEKIENNNAIEAVMANPGDDLWTIGKSLNMSPDTLLEINPELNEPLTKPTKIVIYRSL